MLTFNNNNNEYISEMMSRDIKKLTKYECTLKKLFILNSYLSLKTGFFDYKK